jgi:hypothetical protein
MDAGKDRGMKWDCLLVSTPPICYRIMNRYEGCDDHRDRVRR